VRRGLRAQLAARATLAALGPLDCLEALGPLVRRVRQARSGPVELPAGLELLGRLVTRVRPAAGALTACPEWLVPPEVPGQLALAGTRDPVARTVR